MRLWLMLLFSILAFGPSTGVSQSLEDLKTVYLTMDKTQCKKSEECKVSGRCSTDSYGGCFAATDADCQQSRVCKGLGKCTAYMNSCVKMREDLKDTSTVDFLRKARLTHCRKNRDCKDLGRCTLRTTDLTCIATKDADCRRSRVCKTFGQCTAVDGWCRKR